MGVKLTVTEMLNQIEEFKKELQNNVSQMPDNKKIKRLSPNCFIINSKDLGDNWSPEHHDNLYQAKALIKIIENSESLNSLQNNLESIVQKGKCFNSEYKWLTFNNEVREFVAKLM